MLIDITSPEDRANVFRDLSAIASLCLSEDDASKKSFNLLFNIWEKVSPNLWYLCYWNDFFQGGNIILQAARNVEDIEIEAQILGELGYAYMEGEDYLHAQQYFQSSLQQYQSIENFSKECQLLRYFALLMYRLKQWQSALAYGYQAQEILKTKHNQIPLERLAFYKADLPNIIGCIYLELQNFPESYQQFSLSLDNYQILIENYPDYRYYLPGILLDLGQWHFLSVDYAQANYYYQECLNLSREISRNDKIAEVLLSLAKLAETEGNIELAIQQATEAEQVAGIEIPALRDRAALEKERLLSQQQLPNA
jgi:tetratricopeptide (TPR) repeat protein